MNHPKIGTPHFRGILKQARASGYTFNRAINDILDNNILLAKNISVNVNKKHENQKIDSIAFYDDYEKGFERLKLEGSQNPFNMAHIRVGHDDDRETSEFGMGLKLASMYLGDKITIHTRIINQDSTYSYFRISFNFNEMAERKIPEESYEPSEWYEISPEMYYSQHKYTQGSKIEIEGVRSNTYSLENISLIVDNIKKNIEDTYSYIINERKLNLLLNDIEIKGSVNYLEHPNCSPFNMKSEIYLSINSDLTINKIFVKITDWDTRPKKKEKIKYKMYNNDTGKLEKIDKRDFTTDNFIKLTLSSTTTYWCENPDENDRDSKRKNHYTGGKINIFRYGRRYDSLSYITRRGNGSQNYTYHKLEYTSKIINKILGMNYNKHINSHEVNDFTKFLKEIQKINEGRYNSDTSNKVYKDIEDFGIEKNVFKKRYIDWYPPENEVSNVVENEVSNIVENEVSNIVENEVSNADTKEVLVMPLDVLTNEETDIRRNSNTVEVENDIVVLEDKLDQKKGKDVLFESKTDSIHIYNTSSSESDSEPINIPVPKHVSLNNYVSNIEFESDPEPISVSTTKPESSADSRARFYVNVKKAADEKQEFKCAITGISYKNKIYTPFDYDHSNGKSSNNSCDNCQVLLSDVHAIKTRTPHVFENIKEDPMPFLLERFKGVINSPIFKSRCLEKKIKQRDIKILNGIFDKLCTDYDMNISDSE